jgi:hypothetical protein
MLQKSVISANHVDFFSIRQELLYIRKDFQDIRKRAPQILALITPGIENVRLSFFLKALHLISRKNNSFF